MEGSSYEISVSLDLTGLKCPLPVLKARRQIGQMERPVGDAHEPMHIHVEVRQRAADLVRTALGERDAQPSRARR